MFTIVCTCGKYTADFDTEDAAEVAAGMHILLGLEHNITCTRPAHHSPGSVPVIVFTTKRAE